MLEHTLSLSEHTKTSPPCRHSSIKIINTANVRLVAIVRYGHKDISKQSFLLPSQGSLNFETVQVNPPGSRTLNHCLTNTLTHAHLHMHAHSHMHARIFTHACTFTHARTHIHTCTHAHSHTHAHKCTHARTHTHAHAHICTHTHMHAHTCMHTRTQTHMHTRTHTHTHTIGMP